MAWPLCPGQLAQCGPCFLLIDRLQPVAAVVAPETGALVGVLDWPSHGYGPVPSGPEHGRLVQAAPSGMWVVDSPQGPLCRVAVDGSAWSVPLEGACQLVADAAGCWVVSETEPPGSRPRSPQGLCYVGLDGSCRVLSRSGRVRRLRRHQEALVLEYSLLDPDQAAFGRENADQVATAVLESATVPYHDDRCHPLAWGAAPAALAPQRPGGGRVWSQEPAPAPWHRRDVVVGQDPQGVASPLEVVVEGRVTALAPTDEAVWLIRTGPVLPGTPLQAELMRLHPATGQQQVVVPPEAVDITAHAVAPHRPDQLDPDAYARRQRAALAAALRPAPDGAAAAEFLPGVTVDSVGLAGPWPQTVARVVFRHAERPGLRFVRTISLFNQRGRPLTEPTPAESPVTALRQDLDFGGPPPRQWCQPASDGLVPV